MSDHVIQQSRPPGRTEVPVLSLLANPPVGWKAAPHYAVFRRVRRVGYEDLPLLSVYRDLGIVPREGRDDNHNRPSEDLSNYQRVNKGDLVINKMKAWQGSVGVSDYQGLVSPAYFVFEPVGRNHGRFLHHLLRSDVYTAAYGAISKGIRVDQWDLDPQEHSRLPVLLPPIEEQRRIAAFLDHETARIDELVREQERLNALLQEHKSALILDVVTKGLDQRRELVPSGVFWIGQVPEGWAVAKLGLRYEVQLGKMLDAKQNVGGVQYPYLRNQDVQWDLINTNNLPTFRLEPTELVRYQVLQGDIMVCEGGDVGRAAMWTRRDGVFAYQKALHRLRPKNADRDFPSYLLYALRAAKEAGAYEQNDQRSTISHLTAEAFREYKFPFPPIDEQRRIVEYLDREVSRIEDLAAASRAATELLLERRSALISAAVTGQLDLRDWQAPEPQEAIAEVA